MSKQNLLGAVALVLVVLGSGYAIYRESHGHGHGHEHGHDHDSHGAHADHADHAGHAPHAAPAGAATAPAADGSLRLTPAMVQNVGLQTAEVELRSIEKTFLALGVVEPEPGKVAALASRVAGRVTRLLVHDGQRVRADELLVEVESRVVADPPPRVPFVAPFDGVVLDVHVAPGGPVEPERPLLSVIDLHEVDVVAQVPEAQIAAVRPGQTVQVRTLAHPDLVFTGRVKNTAARLAANGTLPVFVHVENPDAKLLPGMSARLAFVTETSPDAVAVPRAAVLGEGGDLFVFRQLGDTPTEFARTPVTVGLRDESFIEIIEGVLPGDRVVVRGNYPLQYMGGSAAAAKLEDDHGHSHGPGGHSH